MFFSYFIQLLLSIFYFNFGNCIWVIVPLRYFLVSVSSSTLIYSVGSMTSCVYAAGSQTIVDWPSAPASRGVKYSGASEPAHGFCTACSFYVLNRPLIIYQYRTQGKYRASLAILTLFCIFCVLFCSFLVECV